MEIEVASKNPPLKPFTKTWNLAFLGSLALFFVVDIRIVPAKSLRMEEHLQW